MPAELEAAVAEGEGIAAAAPKPKSKSISKQRKRGKDLDDTQQDEANRCGAEFVQMVNNWHQHITVLAE